VISSIRQIMIGGTQEKTSAVGVTDKGALASMKGDYGLNGKILRSQGGRWAGGEWNGNGTKGTLE